MKEKQKKFTEKHATIATLATNDDMPDYPTHPWPKCSKGAWGLSPQGKYYCVECENGFE
jgi:hypothetical protein